MEEQKSFREELVNALLNAVQVENKIREAKKMVDALIKEFFTDESTQLHKSLEEISSNVNSAAISMWSIRDVLKAMAIRDDMPAASNSVPMDAIVKFLFFLRNKAEEIEAGEQAKRDDPDTESKSAE